MVMQFEVMKPLKMTDPSCRQHPSPLQLAKLLVIISLPRDMNQGTMAVHTFFLIARSRVDDGSVGQHGAAFIRNIQQIPVTLHALFIFKRIIGYCKIFLAVVFTLHKVNKDIFDAVEGLLVEKIKRIVRSRQMTIHAIGHKALGIVDMGGCFPGVIGGLNLVTGGTEFGGRGSYHGVIGDAK